MKKIYIALLIALFAVPTVGLQAEEKQFRSEAEKKSPADIEKRSQLEVDVWVDNEDGIYYEGESITIFFHANRDCFVAIYSLDTRGNINLLYPVNPWDNGFVHGDEVYAIPADYSDYELIVTGPEGIEHIQAIASYEEINIPEWYDGCPLRADYYDEMDDFLDHINDRYFTTRWENHGRAFDRRTVYVKTPHYYYKPVYVPHHWYDYPHYGMMYIDYPFGAEIYINGIYFGIAPLWIPRVVIGWHWVTIYDHYGYCWEQRVHFTHDHTIRLDRSRVKTDRTFVSRYKDVRTQPKKYSRSSYVLSDKKVAKTRSAMSKRTTTKDRNMDLRTGKTTTSKKGDRYSTKKPATDKSKRIEDSWNKPKSTKKSGSDYRKSSGSSKKPSGDYNRSGSRKSSGSSVKSSGTSRKSSSGTVKSSGSSSKSSGSKSSSGKSSSSGKKGSSVSKSSGGSKSSSIGRTSSGQSSSGKSSSSKSSSSKSSSKKGGGKKR